MTLVFIVWLIMAFIPAMKVLAIVLLFATLALMFITGMIAADGGETTGFNWVARQLKWAIPFMLIGAFLPNKETTWYMVGAYGTQKIIESPVAQDIASDGVDVLKALMRKAKEQIEAINKEDAPKTSAKSA